MGYITATRAEALMQLIAQAEERFGSIEVSRRLGYASRYLANLRHRYEKGADIKAETADKVFSGLQKMLVSPKKVAEPQAKKQKKKKKKPAEPKPAEPKPAEPEKPVRLMLHISGEMVCVSRNGEDELIMPLPDELEVERTSKGFALRTGNIVIMTD